MNTPPRKESETGLYAPVWRKINQMLDYMREISIVNGRDVRVSRTMNGTLLLGTAKGKEATAATTSRYRVEEVQNDIIVCKKVEGNTVSEDITLIAKPFNLRKTGWDGQTVTYTLDSYPESQGTASIKYEFKTPTYRIAKTVTSAGSTDEHQVITPHYIPGKSIILASEIENETGISGGITFQDLNDNGRAWARV